MSYEVTTSVLRARHRLARLAIPLLLPLGLACGAQTGSRADDGGPPSAGCMAGGKCDAATGDQLEAAEDLEDSRQAYRDAQADLAYHLGTFGAALTDEQRVALVDAFWAMPEHGQAQARYEEAIEQLDEVLESTDITQMMDGFGLGYESGELVFYLEALEALADTPYAAHVIERLGDLREYQRADDPEITGAMLIEITGNSGDYDEQWQQSVAAVAAETVFTRAIVEGREWTQQATDPADAVDEVVVLFSRSAFVGWGTANVIDAMRSAWTASGGQPASFVSRMNSYISTSTGLGPVARSFGVIGAIAVLIPHGLALAEGDYPDELHEAVNIVRGMTTVTAGLRQGFQPMILRLGEQTRWVAVANAASVARALGLFGAALTLGLDVHHYTSSEDINVYDNLAMLGSIMTAGGTVAGALGQVHVGVIAAAVGLPLKMIAGHFAEQQRYHDRRQRMVADSRVLLESIGLSNNVALSLAWAHPDAVQILRGSASPTGMVVGLEPKQLQALAATNAELLYDPEVYEGDALTSESADERALALAAFVEAGLLEPEQVVPFVRSVGQDYYNPSIQRSLDVVGGMVALPSLVASDDPMGDLRYLADTMTEQGWDEATDMDALVSALEQQAG